MLPGRDGRRSLTVKSLTFSIRTKIRGLAQRSRQNETIMLLVGTWKIYEGKRGDAYTYFASLPEVNDASPEFVQLARFHNPSNGNVASTRPWQVA
jgi:hypothetical protein